jgi:tryptophanyl-tRNA synthetase
MTGMSGVRPRVLSGIQPTADSFHLGFLTPVAGH